MKRKEIIAKLESLQEFGDIPKFSIVTTRKYIYVWRNNGQVPKTRNIRELEKLSGSGGYATFIGRFTTQEALDYFSELRGENES